MTTPDAANIPHVVLVRNGTVTHAFGMDQREVEMSFTAGSGALTVTAPPNGNIAPPGYYMVFILNTFRRTLRGEVCSGYSPAGLLDRSFSAESDCKSRFKDQLYSDSEGSGTILWHCRFQRKGITSAHERVV